MNCHELIKWLRQNTTTQDWWSTPHKGTLPDSAIMYGWKFFSDNDVNKSYFSSDYLCERIDLKDLDLYFENVELKTHEAKLEEYSDILSEIVKTFGILPGTDMFKWAKVRKSELDHLSTLLNWLKIPEYTHLDDFMVKMLETRPLNARLVWSEGQKSTFKIDDSSNKPVPIKEKSSTEFDKKTLVPKLSAVAMLNEAAETIGNRASERDTDSERSMANTIKAFNGMYGTELTEEQGWMFMVFLKASRAKCGNFHEDDYIDGSAYFALAGECAGKEREVTDEL